MIVNDIKTIKQVPLGRAQDLTQKVFENFQPLYRIKSTSNKTYWLCKCNCGNYFTADACYINSGRTQSCGCKKTEAQLSSYKNSKRYIDLTNQKFGKWLVLKEVKNKRSSNGHRMWECQCECGTIRTIDTSSLRTGNSKSCGCEVKNRLGKPSNNLIGKKLDKLLILEKTNSSNLKNGIIWKCQCDCGNICYKTTSSLNKSLINSCGCVTLSKGCYEIEQILKSNNITFIKEYKFIDCFLINPLPFDYFLPDYNLLIEFDGEQHFINKPHFEEIEKIHYKDMIKNEYCFKNNILLIRIPYNYSSLSIEDLLPTSKFILNNNNYKYYYEERGLLCN